jgi:hypothetical protein
MRQDPLVAAPALCLRPGVRCAERAASWALRRRRMHACGTMPHVSWSARVWRSSQLPTLAILVFATTACCGSHVPNVHHPSDPTPAHSSAAAHHGDDTHTADALDPKRRVAMVTPNEAKTVARAATTTAGVATSGRLADVEEMARRVVAMDGSTRGGDPSPTCASACDACVAIAASLQANGTWPDIPYHPQPGVDTRSNWPAEEHVTRIEEMGWCVHTGPTCCTVEQTSVLLGAIDAAMTWWLRTSPTNPDNWCETPPQSTHVNVHNTSYRITCSTCACCAHSTLTSPRAHEARTRAHTHTLDRRQR